MRLDIRHLFFIFAMAFALSFAAFLVPPLNPLLFVFCLLFFTILTLRRLEYGMYILLGDLFATSFGYLFQWQGISLRIGMAVVFVGILIYRLLKNVVVRKALLTKPASSSSQGGQPLDNAQFKRIASADLAKTKEEDFDLEKLIEFIKHYKTLSVVYVLLLSWIVISFTHGWLRNSFASSLVDADRYFYLLFLAVIPALKVEKEKVFTILKAGLLWMFVFVSFIEIVSAWFGENDILYKFVRDFRFGEITPFVGNFWRVFLQSEVYAVIGLMLAMVGIFYSRKQYNASLRGFAKQSPNVSSNFLSQRIANAKSGDCLMTIPRTAHPLTPRNVRHYLLADYILLFISTTILLLSLSRSFWLGTLIAVLILFSYIVTKKCYSDIYCYSNIYRSVVFWKKIGVVILITIASIVYIGLISNSLFGVSKVAGSRIDAAEPAASSRSAQFGPLLQGIKQSPFIGYGFGMLLEHTSRDPRAVKSSAGGTGKVSTYAFELGWLDIALKTGLIGTILYFSLIVLLMRTLLFEITNYKLPASLASIRRRGPEREQGGQITNNIQTQNSILKEDQTRSTGYVLRVSFFLSLLALIVIHAFTPYLNHPLGIGFLMIALISCCQDEKEMG